jgi:polysaccharide export outer membrane protein
MKLLYKTLIITVVLIPATVLIVAQEPTAIQPNAPRVALAVEPRYQLRSGDQLDIRFFYQPELNDQVVVRPDGHVSLQLVNDVKVEGMTIQELTAKLKESYSTELKDPQISVALRATAAKIYVSGEVNRAGAMVYLGKMNIVQAVHEAGGLKDTARLDQILVVRPNPDAPPTIFTVNYKKALKGDSSEMAMLHPSDVVIVPRSRIANVNKWVDEYLRKNLPIPVNVGYYPGLP